MTQAGTVTPRRSPARGVNEAVADAWRSLVAATRRERVAARDLATARSSHERGPARVRFDNAAYAKAAALREILEHAAVEAGE